MNKLKSILLTSLMLIATSAHAHYFWINSFESSSHNGRDLMVSMGWGHGMPMGDMFNSVNGRISVRDFDLISPSGDKSALSKPPFKPVDPDKTTDDAEIFSVDMGVNKIVLKKGAQEGAYQVAAASEPTYYTQYKDKKGNMRLKMKAMDEIDGIAKVLLAIKYQAFAKSYITNGKWEKPKALGHGLEIVPRTDLSDVKVGDLVEVDVFFYGKPLSNSPQSREFITAFSSNLGQADGFSLHSRLKKGKAQFRALAAGQWMINVMHVDKVTEDGDLKDMVGKARQVAHAATLTFNVKQ